DRRKEQDRAFTLSVRNNYSLGSSRAGSPRWYQKGSLVMDMLRDVLGVEEFRAVIKHYFEKNYLDYVESTDFTSAVFDITGRDISWFFDEWLYKGGEPHYKVRTVESSDYEMKRSTFFHVEQTHKQNEFVGLFKMPIVFEVHYADGSFDRVKQFIEKQYTVVKIPNPKYLDIEYTLFDPGRRVMKTVEFNKPFDELSAQAIKAENMIDRYDALVALGERRRWEKIKLFKQIMLNEKFYLLKQEVVSQTIAARTKALQEDNSNYVPGDLVFGNEYSEYQKGKKNYEDIMRMAFNDSDPRVRLEAAEKVGRIELSLKSDVEKMLTDISYPNISAALELLCHSFPGKVNSYLERTKNLLGWRGLNIRMAWLKIAVELGKDEYYIMLEDYASLSFEFETRINAINILKAQNYLTEASAYHILEASTSRNRKVGNTAVAAL
ncbi:MAG: hypothetical protein KAH48_12745, partial [Chlorobi bacterium]|nr:hypothetical protein [Chlorobiota bacterium]